MFANPQVKLTVSRGMIDRVLRGVAALAMILAPFLTDMGLMSNHWSIYPVVLVGPVSGGTAAAGACPADRFFGFGTQKA